MEEVGEAKSVSLLKFFSTEPTSISTQTDFKYKYLELLKIICSLSWRPELQKEIFSYFFIFVVVVIN